MKIIDEKGRLFGKINVIDFLVILFLISLTPMFYYGYKIFNAPPPPPPPLHLIKGELYYDIDVVFKDIPERMVKMIQAGDREIDSNKSTIGEIIEINGIESESYQIEYSISGVKQTDILGVGDKKRVKARMRLLVEPQFDNSVTYKGVRINYGQAVEFKTDTYIIRGMFSPPPPQKQVIVNVRVDNVIPEIYRFVKTGDVMKIPEIRESTDNLQKEKKYIKIAEIKRIISMENVKREFYSLKRDELVQIDHPSLKNIILEIDALCYEEGGQYIFNGRPARLGSPFTFQNESYEINGTVLDILKKHL